jgi:hypothetical protein
MDVFSCKPFDYDATLRIIESRLGVVRRAADVIRRPVVGAEVVEAEEMRWRVQPLPAPVPASYTPVMAVGAQRPSDVQDGSQRQQQAAGAARELVGVH